jgi:hypothetical protein
MKKLLFLFIIILNSCGCIIGQIPPQYIYAGAGCTTPVPDYLSKVTISDNCSLKSVIQIPASGFLLTSTNMITDVIIKATDNSGNIRQVKFTVTLLDTIKPIITIDTLTGYNVLKATEFYDLADSFVAKIVDTLSFKKWLFVISHKDSAGFRERLITFKDTLKFPL